MSRKLISLIKLLMLLALGGISAAQELPPPSSGSAEKVEQEKEDEKKDPTRPSRLIQEIKDKIRDVEQFDQLQRDYNQLLKEKETAEKKFAADLQQLRQQHQAEVGKLKGEISSLTEQLAELRAQLSELQAKKKQKTDVKLPAIEVVSRVIGERGSIAQLKIGETTSFFREGEVTRIPSASAEPLEAIIKRIDHRLVEIEFPTLGRSLVIY